MKILGTEKNQYVLEELGKRIRDTRVALEYTQKDMAARAGISQKSLERIEKGENVRVDAILNVLRAMNILQNIEMLVPEQTLMPTELHDRGKKRVRVRKDRTRNNSHWEWGDDS